MRDSGVQADQPLNQTKKGSVQPFFESTALFRDSIY